MKQFINVVLGTYSFVYCFSSQKWFGIIIILKTIAAFIWQNTIGMVYYKYRENMSC